MQKGLKPLFQVKGDHFIYQSFHFCYGQKLSFKLEYLYKSDLLNLKWCANIVFNSQNQYKSIDHFEK